MSGPDQDILWRFFAERDVRCPSCGYSLRNCQSQKCPECGTSLELGVRIRPISAWWQVAVIGLALAVAALAYHLVASLPSAERIAAHNQIIQMVAQGFSPQSELIDWPMLIKLAVALGVGVSLLGGLIASRRRFATWSAGVQIGIGLGGALSPLLVIALLWMLARGW